MCMRAFHVSNNMYTEIDVMTALVYNYITVLN